MAEQLQISTGYNLHLYLWRSREVVIDMLTDRGHMFRTQPVRYATKQEFVKNLLHGETNPKEARALMTINSSVGSIDHAVVWIENVTVASLREIQLFIASNESQMCLIVHKEEIKSYSKDTLKDLKVEGFRLETMLERSLQFNVTKHVRVPPHIPMSKEEVKQLLEGYECNLEQLPKIKKNDPVARYYGARLGSVFKIIRTSDTDPSIKSLYYRVVSR